MPHVRIDGVGTAPVVQSAPRDAVGLAVQAATACLDNSGVDPAALDLILYAGVYRDDFIAEPAIAALVAGELGINDDIESPDDQRLSPSTCSMARSDSSMRVRSASR